MASKGTPLGIGLGIDFQKLDADLNTVADKIEKVGQKTSLKVGTFAGMASTGQLKGDQLQSQVANIGVSLSQGIASGVRVSSASILGFASRINAMLDRLAGTAITMFQRIDAAMKFPRWNALLTSMRLSLSGFASGGTRAMTDLDRAMGGGFGRIAQTAARIMKPLFDDLGRSMGGPLREAIDRIGPMMATEMAKVVAAVEAAANKIKFALTNAIEEIAVRMKGLRVAAGSAGEASAEAFMAGFRRTGGYLSEFGERQKKMRPSHARLAGYFGGLKPGQRAELLEPPKPPAEFTGARPAPQMLKGYAEILRDIAAMGQRAGAAILEMGRAAGATPALQLAKQSAILFGQSLVQMLRFGAGTASAFLGVGQAIYRAQNFMSSLGSVSGKTFSQIYSSHGLFVGSLLGSIKLVKMLGGAILDLVTLRAFSRVSQDAGVLGKSVQATTGAVRRLTGSVARMGVELLAAFGVVGVAYKLVQFFKGGITGATTLNEKVAESKVVFGAASGAVAAQADAISKKFGIMRAEQVQVANQFGEMAQGAGMAESASAGFANRMTELTLNLAKFQALPIAEAAEHVRMGLGGSGRALRQYGVFLDDAKVKGLALAEGIELVGKKLDTEDTVASRAAIVMHDLSYVMGTLDRLSGGAAAQFKKAGGGVAEFGVRIGEVLMPAVEKLTDAFNTLLASLLDLFEKNLPTITTWANTVKDKMKSVGVVVRNFGDVWKIAQLKAEEFFANFIINMDTWADNLETIAKRAAKNGLGQTAKDEANDFLTSTANVIASGANILDAAWAKITKGKEFNPVIIPRVSGTKNVLFGEGQPGEPKLKPTPSPISFQDKIDKIMDEINKREAAIPEIKPAPPPKKPPPLPEAATAKHTEYKLAAAVEVTSKEAAATIARSLSPGARLADPARQGLVVAKDSNSALHQIVINTGRKAGLVAAAVKPLMPPSVRTTTDMLFFGKFGKQASLVKEHSDNAARMAAKATAVADQRAATAAKHRRESQILAMPKAERAAARLAPPAAAAMAVPPAGPKKELFGAMPLPPKAFGGGPGAAMDPAAARADLAAENRMLAAKAGEERGMKERGVAGEALRRMAEVAAARADLERENLALMKKVEENTRAAKQGAAALQVK